MYPKIYYPKYYSELQKRKITIKDIYPSIEIPLLPNKSGFKENLAEENIKTFFGCAILGIFISFFGCMFFTVFIFDNEKQFWASGGRTILFFTTILIAILGTLFLNKQLKKSNDSIEKLHERRMVIYKKELEKYNSKLSEVNNPIFQKTFKKKVLLEKAKKSKLNILHSSQILPDIDIKKGISELFFHDFLIKHSNFIVYKSIKLGYYFPDLILIHKNYDIVVDIEIDEPYSFDLKEPIHYDNIDSNRDKFFSENDFLIIRFCEDQIVNHPHYCLNVINETVNEFVSLNEIRNVKSSSILEFEMEAWSHERAFNLAYSNSRNNIIEKVKKARELYI